MVSAESASTLPVADHATSSSPATATILPMLPCPLSTDILSQQARQAEVLHLFFSVEIAFLECQCSIHLFKDFSPQDRFFGQTSTAYELVLLAVVPRLIVASPMYDRCVRAVLLPVGIARMVFVY
jgi:hypothetical protein